MSSTLQAKAPGAGSSSGPSVTCSADRLPAAETAVVFACDANYAPYAQFAAAQIIRLNPRRNFDVCICTSDPELVLTDDLARAGGRLCRVDTGGLLSSLSLDGRRTEASYLRLALPAAFAGAYRRLLYLNSDVFVQGGDFGALMDLDLGGAAVAAVRDNIQWRTRGRRPEEFRRMGLPAAPYCNSGVLLLDVQAYRDQRVLERCLDFAQEHPGALLLDQSLLNLVLRGDWAELAPAWNWQYTRASMLFEGIEEVHIVHFIGPKKPWKHAGGRLPLKFRRAYRSFLAEHFPDGPAIGPDGPPPHRSKSYLRNALWRHLLAAGRFSAYLAQFKTDLTVLPPYDSRASSRRGARGPHRSPAIRKPDQRTQGNEAKGRRSP